MRRFSRNCLLIVLFSSSLPAQSSGFVGVRGKEIVTADGKPLLLRGINLGNWLVPEGYMFKFDSATSPRFIEDVLNELLGPEDAQTFWRAYRDAYVTRADIARIKRVGFNSIRVPFNWRLFLSEDDFTTVRKEGFEMLDRVVGWCREEGVWAILDMHCAPGGQTGDNIDDSWGYPFLFESPKLQRATAQIWTAIAARYGNEPSVLGYDLLNEPIAHYFSAEQLNPQLEPLYKKITAAIRAVDTNHIVILGGSQWDSNFRPFGQPFDTKLVYTFHKYWTAPSKEVIQEYLDFRDLHNVPIWMGESGENKNAWIDTFRTTLEENRVGWCFWPYKKMNATTCPVTFAEPDGWGEIKKFANAHRETYRALRSLKPKTARIASILRDFLDRCRAERCTVNLGYIQALGLQAP